MKKALFQAALQMLMAVMTPELMKIFADKILDFLEDYVLGTKSTVDDALILPAVASIRNAFGISDNDDLRRHHDQ